jgi:hypothetical protein
LLIGSSRSSVLIDEAGRGLGFAQRAVKPDHADNLALALALAMAA